MLVAPHPHLHHIGTSIKKGVANLALLKITPRPHTDQQGHMMSTPPFTEVGAQVFRFSQRQATKASVKPGVSDIQGLGIGRGCGEPCSLLEIICKLSANWRLTPALVSCTIRREAEEYECDQESQEGPDSYLPRRTRQSFLDSDVSWVNNRQLELTL
jgi:hypothetical protein